MNVFLTLLSLVTISYFGIYQFLKYKRFKAVNRMVIVYDKIEMFFIKNKIHLTCDYIEFLKLFKNLTVNPEYLDVQVLILHKIAAENKGILKTNANWFNKILDSLGPDFLEIFDEFDASSNKVIKMSFYKPDFLVFRFQLIVKYRLGLSIKSFKTFLSDSKFVREKRRRRSSFLLWNETKHSSILSRQLI